jgi:hypothetical protein
MYNVRSHYSEKVRINIRFYPISKLICYWHIGHGKVIGFLNQRQAILLTAKAICTVWCDVYMFWFSWTPWPTDRQQKGPLIDICTLNGLLALMESWTWGFITSIVNRSKQNNILLGRCYFISQGLSLQTQPWQMAWG